jgi:hypothetical protein
LYFALTRHRDEEEEVRGDAFVGAIDLFPAVAVQQQQQLVSEFKNIILSCSEDHHSSSAARAFNRCIAKHLGALYVTLGRALHAEEVDCSFFLSAIKRFCCDFGAEVRALVAFNMPAFYTAFGASKNMHLLGSLQRLLHDAEASVRVAAAKTLGVISCMISAEQRQGVLADAFLKLFEDADEATLMAALASFQQAGPHLSGILPSLTARSICNALVGLISSKVSPFHRNLWSWSQKNVRLVWHVAQELAWRQQLAAALAFNHASQWATNQLTSDVIVPCLIKLLKVRSHAFHQINTRLLTLFDCRTVLPACAIRSTITTSQYTAHPLEIAYLRLLMRQQVSGVLISVLVMSRSFGTRMNAMEVPAFARDSALFSLFWFLSHLTCADYRAGFRALIVVSTQTHVRSHHTATRCWPFDIITRS